MRPPKTRQGYLLIAAFSLMLAMVAIALVLANLGRTAHGLSVNTQMETYEYEAVQVAIVRVLGALGGQADPSGLVAGNPPASGSAIQGSVPLSGTNDTAGLGQVFLKGVVTTLPVDSDGGAEGFSTTVALGHLMGMGYLDAAKVPAQTAAAVIKATINDRLDYVPSSYLALYSRLYPFALLAPAGSINVASLRTVSDPDGADSHLAAMPAHVAAQGSITVSGTINGRAYSSGGSISLGSGGVAYPNWPNANPVPDDLNNQVNDFKGSVTSGLDADLDNLFKDWHGCLHKDFSAAQGEAVGAAEAQCLSEGGTLDTPIDAFGGAETTQKVFDSPGDTDYNSDGGTLTIGTSLHIPGGEKHTLSFQNVNISGDLYLEDGAILYVKGSLSVSGAIDLGKKASLVVDGTTQAAGLNLTYAASNSSGPLISSSLYGKGGISLSQGMGQVNATFIPSIPSPKSCPYPDTLNFGCIVANDPAYEVEGSCSNPACINFTAQVAACTPTAGQIVRYLGSVTALPLPGTTPGALIVGDSTLTIQGKAAGLLVTSQDISLQGSSFVGAAYTSNGSIQAASTDVRFYPYYTHAYGATAGGSKPVGAWRYHMTGAGRLP